MAKKIVVAICYDFDGTLSPGNMQEYGFFSSLGKESKKFWEESNKLAHDNKADPILCYMCQMIKKAKIGEGTPTTKKAFHDYGKSVVFFPGVEPWFDRINTYGKERGVTVEHYIVSSGLKEFIEGTKIARKFKKVYACSFLYDNNDAAEWPAVAVNYTTKTQFLFRINKGIEDDADNKTINKYVADNERRIPFSRMIYLGDGETDVPCMKLTKEKGGTSIAVYQKGTVKKRKIAKQLLQDKRVNFALPADYSENGKLDQVIKSLIDRIAAENAVSVLANQNQKSMIQPTEEMDSPAVAEKEN